MKVNRRPTEKHFIGLDLSLTGTGVVVLNSAGKAIKYFTIKNKLRGMERLHFIRDKIIEVLEAYPEGKYCVENYAMGTRAGQAFSIGELGGVIKLLLYNDGVTPTLVPPTRLKKFITGGGKAEKDMILLKVFQRWGFSADDNNQADAYGLAKIAYTLEMNPDGLNKAQNEVIDAIRNPPEPKKRKSND